MINSTLFISKMYCRGYGLGYYYYRVAYREMNAR